MLITLPSSLIIIINSISEEKERIVNEINYYKSKQEQLSTDKLNLKKELNIRFNTNI